jgi:intermembrane space import and assembly protein 40
MQDCFRKYPEIYGSELTDDEDGEGAPAPEGDEALAKKDDGERKSALTAVTEDGPFPKEAVDATKANSDKEQ